MGPSNDVKNQVDAFADSPIDPDKMQIDAELRARWPRSLAEMFDVLAQAFADQKDPAHVASVALRALSRHFGGVQVYLPQGKALEIAVRDRMIWREFNGRNVHELCARHKLTQVQVYKIIAEQRAIAVRKFQPDLFTQDK